MSDRTRQLAIGERAPLTWEALKYAGEKRGQVAVFFGLHPLTQKTVEVTYDRLTGQSTSRPSCPELEAVARFAAMVRDEWHQLRECKFGPRQLAGILETQALIVAARPDDQQARAQLAALGVEVRRREALGPIAEAQRAGGDVRALVNADLFTDGC